MDVALPWRFGDMDGCEMLVCGARYRNFNVLLYGS